MVDQFRNIHTTTRCAKMTRNVRLAVALVAVLALLTVSGCVASPPADDAADAKTSPPAFDGELSWGLSECRYVVSWGFVDGDSLAPHLPEGFTVRRSEGVAGVPAPGGDTLFGLDAMTCSSGQGLDGVEAPMEAGYVWAAADPPESLLQGGIPAAEHYVKWDVLVPDDARRGLLLEYAVPVRDGSASVRDTTLGQDAQLRLDGVGTLTIQTVESLTIGAFDGEFVKFTESANGVVAWRAHAVSGERTTGDAVLSFPEGSWMADVVGDTMLRGAFHSGTWTYEPARLVFLEVE